MKSAPILYGKKKKIIYIKMKILYPLGELKSKEEFLEKVCEIIKNNYLKLEEGDLRFSMIALQKNISNDTN